MERLSGQTPDSSERNTAEAAAVRALELIQPIARQLQAVTGAAGVVEMPEMAGRP